MAGSRSVSVNMPQKTYTWKEAFEDAHQAAEAGNPQAQNFVGYCYDVGKGVPRDLSMARRWFEKATQNGNVAAIFNLAVMNDLGQGTRRNSARAVRLYRQAASLGHLQAQTNLAVMLLDGVGTKEDVLAGLHWMRRAARRGDPKGPVQSRPPLCRWRRCSEKSHTR